MQTPVLKAGFQQRGQSTCRAGGTGVTGSLSCEQHHQVPDACARDIADKCFRRKASSHLHTCSGRAKDGDGHEKSDLFLFMTGRSIVELFLQTGK